MAKSSKKHLNLFIDTNVLLGFYRFTEDDLDKLSQLEDLIVKTKDVKLFVTEQQIDEFNRNRDVVIAQALKEVKAEFVLPKLFSGHPKYRDITTAARNLKNDVATLRQDTLDGALKQSLRADEIIQRLLSTAIKTRDEVMTRAKIRMDAGNPPGKNGSLGDAINWEIMLDNIPPSEDVHIISVDGDYRSPLGDFNLNTFLEREWMSRKASKAYLYGSLNGFFSQHFAHIKLMDEYIKDDLINQLSEANSFDRARFVIGRLRHIGGLSEGQVRRLFSACVTNDQVYGAHSYSPTIVGDRLWELIEPYWSKFSDEEQEVWISHFPDEKMREYEVNAEPPLQML